MVDGSVGTTSGKIQHKLIIEYLRTLEDSVFSVFASTIPPRFLKRYLFRAVDWSKSLNKMPCAGSENKLSSRQIIIAFEATKETATLH